MQDATGGPPTYEDADLWAVGLELTFSVLADADGSFTPVYNPSERLPMAYIVDRDGVIVWNEAGGTGSLEEMESVVLDLLGP